MTVAIIQARTSSKRLPNKVMKIINGKRLINFVYDRVKISKKVSKIYIAISNLKRDDKLASYCKKKKYNFYRGELNNVLGRYCSLIEKKGISSLVRVNGDSPCIDPKLIDKAIDIFKKKKMRYGYKCASTHLSKRCICRSYQIKITFRFKCKNFKKI